MRFLQDYDRKAAVLYAHAWAYGRNPAFYDYEQVGGDCTNFASQCIFAGCGIMNFTPTYGWYYITANQKCSCLDRGTVPVELSHPQDLLRGTGRGKCRPGGSPAGDIVQLSFTGDGTFQHSPVVVATGTVPTLENTLIAAHSYDADNRPLSTYQFQDIRFLHITVPSVLKGNS